MSQFVKLHATDTTNHLIFPFLSEIRFNFGVTAFETVNEVSRIAEKLQNNSRNAAIVKIEKRSSIDSGNPNISATERQNAAVKIFLPGEELEPKNEICKHAVACS